MRGRKLNFQLVFIVQFCFKVPEDIRLNATHYFIKKIPNKRELQQKASNNSCDIKFQDFMRLYKYYTFSLLPFSLLVNDATLPSDNPLKCRKNLIKNDF